ncbi:MAG TPA: hypothetical protein PKL88_02615, partial [bacterium]|nr:hypothetical protein [bacterium]
YFITNKQAVTQKNLVSFERRGRRSSEYKSPLVCGVLTSWPTTSCALFHYQQASGNEKNLVSYERRGRRSSE